MGIARLPKILLQNTTNLGRWSSADLEASPAKEVTFQVNVDGTPTFSIDLEGSNSLLMSGPNNPWGKLLTVTAAGFYTVNSHWVRYLSANLTSISGTGSVSVSVLPSTEG